MPGEIVEIHQGAGGGEKAAAGPDVGAAGEAGVWRTQLVDSNLRIVGSSSRLVALYTTD